MSPGRYLPDHDFPPAPAGTRVRLVTLLTFVAVAGVAIALPVATRRPHAGPVWVPFAAAAVALLVVTGIWFGSRIRGYRLTAAELLVRLRFRTVRFPLAQLQDVAPDREALRGAWKQAGNDGLGAISGRFRSRRLGRFRAYVTDSDRAVVLRWPDFCLVISPDQPAWFVENARRHAGQTTPR